MTTIKMTTQETRRTKSGATRVVPCAWFVVGVEGWSSAAQCAAVDAARAAGYALYAAARSDGTVVVAPGLLVRETGRGDAGRDEMA